MLEGYILDALNSYLGDPADSDYQRGYLAALLEVASEMGLCVPRSDELHAQLRGHRS